MSRRALVVALLLAAIACAATFALGMIADRALTCSAEDVVLVNSHTDDPSCIHVDEL